MIPAVIGAIAARYIPGGGTGPGDSVFNFPGVPYTPPVSGATFNFPGVPYTPPASLP